MEVPIEGRIVEAQHAGDPADRDIGAARGEGGAMHAFVHRREQRHDRHAVQYHRRHQQPPRRHRQPHQQPSRRHAAGLRRQVAPRRAGRSAASAPACPRRRAGRAVAAGGDRRFEGGGGHRRQRIVRGAAWHHRHAARKLRRTVLGRSAPPAFACRLRLGQDAPAERSTRETHGRRAAAEEHRDDRRRVADALRIGGALPCRRPSRLDRPDQHAFLGAGTRRAGHVPDQPLRPDVRRDHRLEPDQDGLRRQRHRRRRGVQQRRLHDPQRRLQGAARTPIA